MASGEMVLFAKHLYPLFSGILKTNYLNSKPLKLDSQTTKNGQIQNNKKSTEISFNSNDF